MSPRAQLVVGESDIDDRRCRCPDDDWELEAVVYCLVYNFVQMLSVSLRQGVTSADPAMRGERRRVKRAI